MRTASLTPLLVRAREDGLTLEAEGDGLAVSPRTRLTPELRDELLRHKPELIRLVTWNEEGAHALIKDALAYLNEFYVGADRLDCELSGMHAPEDLIDEAFANRDMHLMRVAVRQWVQAGLAAFRDMDRDRGAA